MMQDFQIVALGIAVKVGVALIGLFLVPYLLSRNNTRIGGGFRNDVQQIKANPLAAAVFHGLVFVGMCVLLGLLFG